MHSGKKQKGKKKKSRHCQNDDGYSNSEITKLNKGEKYLFVPPSLMHAFW